MSVGLIIAAALFTRLPFAAEMQAFQTPPTSEERSSSAPEDELARAEAWMRLVDERQGWSKSPSWRRLNRWSDPLFGPSETANLIDAGFASPEGRRSPADDFASFAARALLEPHDASNERLACRLRSQWRHLRSLLEALPESDRPSEMPDDAPCPAFRRWKDEATFERFELLLAAPSSVTLGSLFGHLALRLVRSDGSAREDEVMAFLALNDLPFEADPLYALKGLSGYYRASIVSRSLVRILNEYLVHEGRDLERYELHLRPEEREAFFDRLWTARHALQFRYYFLNENCATLLLELLRDVLAPDAHFDIPDLLGASPTAAVDALALVRREDGTQLLTPIHDTFVSMHREAMEAALRRRPLARALIGRHPRLKDAFAGAESDDESQRAESIRLISGALSTEASSEVDEWLAAQATIELHLSRKRNALEEAELDKRRRERLPQAAREECEPFSEASLLFDSRRERRLEGFSALARQLPEADEDTAARLRRCGALHLVRLYGDRLDEHPGIREPLFFTEPKLFLEDQPWAASVRPLLYRERITRLTEGIEEIQKARRARRQLFAQTDSLAAIQAAHRESLKERERRDYERAWPHTGIDSTRLTLQWSEDRWAFGFGGAIYDERLGDLRKHGFPGNRAFTFLSSDLLLGPWEGRPQLVQSKLRVVGWRALPRQMPEEKSSLPSLGWDLALDSESSRAHGLLQSTRLAAALLFPLAGSVDAGSHLFVRLGGDWSLSIPLNAEASLSHGPSAALGLEGRLTPRFFDAPHFFEAGLQTRSAWDFAVEAAWWSLEMKAALSFALLSDFALPLIGHTGLRLSVGARHERSEGPFVPLKRTLVETVLTID